VSGSVSPGSVVVVVGFGALALLLLLGGIGMARTIAELRAN
jgi:hypothetical protein